MMFTHRNDIAILDALFAGVADGCDAEALLNRLVKWRKTKPTGRFTWRVSWLDRLMLRLRTPESLINEMMRKRLAKLVKRGWVEQRPAPRDAEGADRYRLTEAGMAQLRRRHTAESLRPLMPKLAREH